MRDQNCKVIIFAQTKKRVDDFFVMIKRLGYTVFPIHGDKRQQERDRVLQGLFAASDRCTATSLFLLVSRVSQSILRRAHCH